MSQKIYNLWFSASMKQVTWRESDRGLLRNLVAITADSKSFSPTMNNGV